MCSFARGETRKMSVVCANFLLFLVILQLANALHVWNEFLCLRSLSPVDWMKSSSNAGRKIYRHHVQSLAHCALTVLSSRHTHFPPKFNRTIECILRVANRWKKNIYICVMISIRFVCEGNGHGDKRLPYGAKYRGSCFTCECRFQIEFGKKRPAWQQKKNWLPEIVPWFYNRNEFCFFPSFSFFCIHLFSHFFFICVCVCVLFSNFKFSNRISLCFVCEIDSMRVTMLLFGETERLRPNRNTIIMVNCAHAIAFLASINQISCVQASCVHWMHQLHFSRRFQWNVALEQYVKQKCPHQCSCIDQFRCHWNVFRRKTKMVHHRQHIATKPFR